MSESAYNSPLLARKLPDSCFSSPARSIASIGEPLSLTDSELTETESESLDLVTEIPGLPDQTIVDGWVKFRDNKRFRVLHVCEYKDVHGRQELHVHMTSRGDTSSRPKARWGTSWDRSCGRDGEYLEASPM
ncbi:hypothetical protein CBL_13578 [Carabus blaptoides fortunei]